MVRSFYGNYSGYDNIPLADVEDGEYTHIYLRRNRIKSLNGDLVRLSGIQQLHVPSNYLENVPPTIRHLVNLTHLNLSDNQLRKLPEELCDLPNLQNLDLTCNNLTDLPTNIGSLTHLHVLSAVHNRLIDLPKSIGDCPSLKYLYLDNNDLTRIPEQITRLAHLKELSLKGNRLVHLPLVPFCSSQVYVYLSSNENLCHLHMSINGFTKLGNGAPKYLDPDSEGAIDIHLSQTQKEAFYEAHQRIDTEQSAPVRILVHPSLLYIHNVTFVPRLIELCLRRISSLTHEKLQRPLYDENVRLQSSIRGCNADSAAYRNRLMQMIRGLPVTLGHLLDQGPTAYCWFCNLPIFTESELRVTFQPPDHFRLQAFCSHQCLEQYEKWIPQFTTLDFEKIERKVPWTTSSS